VTVLIDSWAWIEYWRGGPKAKEAAEFIEGRDDALASAINLAELYHWILLHYDERTAERKRRTVEGRCFTISLDGKLAVEAAKIKINEKLSLADAVVLATARAYHSRVISGYPDFKGLERASFG